MEQERRAKVTWSTSADRADIMIEKLKTEHVELVGGHESALEKPMGESSREDRRETVERAQIA